MMLATLRSVNRTDCRRSPLPIGRNTGPVVMFAPTSQPRSAATRAGGDSAHDGDDRPLAFLVGLAVSDRDTEAFGGVFDVLDVERDELGASEGPGKSKQKQGAIAQIGKSIGPP
jgi:hypothetical protein